MRGLTKRNAIALSDAGWDDDVEILLKRLESSGIAPAEAYRQTFGLSRARSASALVLFIVIAIAIGLLLGAVTSM